LQHASLALSAVLGRVLQRTRVQAVRQSWHMWMLWSARREESSGSGHHRLAKVLERQFAAKRGEESSPVLIALRISFTTWLRQCGAGCPQWETSELAAKQLATTEEQMRITTACHERRNLVVDKFVSHLPSSQPNRTLDFEAHADGDDQEGQEPYKAGSTSLLQRLLSQRRPVESNSVFAESPVSTPVRTPGTHVLDSPARSGSKIGEVSCSRSPSDRSIVEQVPTPHRFSTLRPASRAAPQGLHMAWAAAEVASERRMLWRSFLAWRRHASLGEATRKEGFHIKRSENSTAYSPARSSPTTSEAAQYGIWMSPDKAAQPGLWVAPVESYPSSPSCSSLNMTPPAAVGGQVGAVSAGAAAKRMLLITAVVAWRGATCSFRTRLSRTAVRR